MLKLLAVVTCVVLSVPAWAQTREGQPLDPRLAALRAEIADRSSRGEFVSISVGVVLNGNVVWAESFGNADREAGRRATPQTRYGLASLGKSITGTAVMTLVERGRLSLEQPVFDILGKGAIRSATCGTSPTVRQLLNMSAGFAHGAETYNANASPPSVEIPPARAFLAFCPGSAYFYSNYSIAAADRVIEAVSKRPFGQYLARRVFGPLGMRSAALGTPRGFEAPAARYDSDGRRIRDLITRPRSSRDMYASLDDLLRYAAFNLQRSLPATKQILSAASINRMHTDIARLPGATTALGWGSLELGGGQRWLITNGNDLGVQSSITLLPSSGVGVVVLINQSGGQADELAIRIAEALAPGTMASIEALKARYFAGSASFVTTAEWLGQWTGRIETPQGGVPLRLEIRRDNQILATIGQAAAATLVDAKLEHGLLTGNFEGRIALEQSAPANHRVEIVLRPGNDRLEGFLTANFANSNGQFELPAAVTMTRTSD